MKLLVSGHEVDIDVWLRVPLVEVPPLVDESMPFDVAAESLLGERFGFTFEQEMIDPASAGERGVVEYLVARDRTPRVRPVANRVVIAHGRAAFFDYDLAVLDASGDDEHAVDRFRTFGIGLYLRTPKVWRTADGWWAAVTIQGHLLSNGFGAAIERALAPRWLVGLSPTGEVMGRG